MDDSSYKPRPDGVSVADTPNAEGVISVPRLSVLPEGHDLTAVAKDMTLFTPALLYCVVRLNGRDPLLDYYSEQPEADRPTLIQLQKPVFAKFERWDARWNRVLLGMPHEAAKAFIQWIGSAAFVDRGLGQLTRVRYKKVRIVDHRLLARQGVTADGLPLVPVTVCCTDSNKGCYYLEEPSTVTLRDLPYVVFTRHVMDDTQRLADAVLNGGSVPLVGASPIPQTQGS